MVLGPDLREHDISWPPDQARLLFGGAGLLMQENLDLLMAIMSQRHEEAADNTSKKLPQTEPEQKKHRLSHMLFFSTILIVF